MSISPAIFSASRTISAADSDEWATSALAAATASGPPEPMPMMPSRRLDHVAGAADEQAVLGVGHDHQRFQPPQRPVGPPVLGQLRRRPRHIARIVLQLGLEPLQQGEGVGARRRQSRTARCRPAAGGSWSRRPS